MKRAVSEMTDEEGAKRVHTSEDSYRWIMWHLTAMDYARAKMETKLSEILVPTKPMPTDPSELRSRIVRLKDIIKWYTGIIENHRTKAMERIPESKRAEWEKEMRTKENQSYEALFIRESESEIMENETAIFVPADELKKGDPSSG
jgi:hypothetical protein